MVSKSQKFGAGSVREADLPQQISTFPNQVVSLSNSFDVSLAFGLFVPLPFLKQYVAP